MRNDDYSKPIYSTSEIHCAVSDFRQRKGQRMTNEEAKKIIKSRCYFASVLPDTKEALDMAIEALSVEPQKMGRWIHKCINGDRFCECSVCYSQTYQVSQLYEFCPHCGAEMKGVKHE